MKKDILVCALVLVHLLNGGCNAQNEKKEMKETIDVIKSGVQTYKETPVYTVQINKQGCRLVLEMRGNVDYRLTENNGESMMLPLNAMITGSGPQTALVKIYPKEGDAYLTKYAHVTLNFFHAPDRQSRLSEYKTIASFELPGGLEEKKLPYYETTVQFTAKVPFDYAAELNAATDLKSIPDIDEKVRAKYNQIRRVCENLDSAAYNKYLAHSSALVYNTTYTDAAQIEKSEASSSPLAMVDPQVKNRSFLPIQDVVTQYYANGKIVALWQKNLAPALYMKGEVASKDGGSKPVEAGDPIFLYLPKGSSELQVW
ncbi:hypothetical protein [Pedobacter sp. SYP-B3415]|uniref:hypothetical protein n=1 Tax=Pedobacter sp. SYP-B3415 TaxID=2496641 RepID=UPI00101DF7BE|nr:hypothetical protein [Pedobacter sp. SYP-B3415]